MSGSAKQGKQIFDAVGCLGCHAVHGRGGNIGPGLSDEGARGRSREWLKTQIRDPKANKPQSQMFPFDYLSDRQVSDLVDYLESLTPTSAKPTAPGAPGASASLSPGARQGKQLFDKVGCLGCHMVNGKGGNVGPDLSNAANEGHSRQWLKTQIREPKSHDPQTAMPAFNNLSDQQVNDLVDYLETLSTKSPAAGAPSAPRTSSVSPGAKRGKELFDALACQECHRVNGEGGKVGPDLSNEGSKGHSRAWLKTQIRNPRAHMRETAMPAWDNLPEQDANDLVDYLESLKAGPGPPGPGSPGRAGGT